MASEREASAWPRPRAFVPRCFDERTSTFIPSSVWGHSIPSGFASVPREAGDFRVALDELTQL